MLGPEEVEPMLNSKEEARAEAHKRILAEVRAQADMANERAEAAEIRAAELELSLAAAHAAKSDAERLARSHAEQASWAKHGLEGASADLLATTKRALMNEILLKDASVRIEELRAVVGQVATWPLAYSTEAKAMREAAKRTLAKDDQLARRNANLDLDVSSD